ncbi:MAG: tetratricopeptide repeat protein [Candidatus Obscuribacterales bacterium]|nr:tetratricopeptide repeat protein [Candidatus Obscuribacterales bacterium]
MSKSKRYIPQLVSLGLLFSITPSYCGQAFIQSPTMLPPAVHTYTQQIQSEPSAANYSRRAEILRRLGLRKEAVDDLNQSLNLEPKNVSTRVLRGRVYFEDGMYPEAVQNLDAAIDLDPKFLGSYELRSRAYLGMKDYGKALADANTILGLNPKSGVGFLLRGAAYVGLKKYSDAIDDCTSAINADNTLDKAYYWRAEAYQRSGDFQKSVDDYLQAIRLQPEYRPAMIGLAWSYYKLGKDDEALKACSEGIKFRDANDLLAVNMYEGERATDSDDMPDPAYNLGMQIEEDLKNCISIFDDILKDKPGNPEAARDRGIAYMHLGKYTEALKDFETANKGLPALPDDFSGLGSEADYRSAVPLYKQGNQDLANGDFASAIKNYQAALKLYPQYGRCWHNLAIACSNLGDNFSAELCSIHSVSYRPDDWKLWHTLGAALYSEYKQDKGDPKKLAAAARALQQALELKPDTEEDKNDVRHLLASVKSYERSLTPIINFQITTMPVN